MVSSDGFISRYDLVNLKSKGDGSIDRYCDFRSCIFLQDPNDEFKMMIVGSENNQALCRVYNQKEDYELNYRDEAHLPGIKPLRKFSEVKMVQSQS
jgi:hypothetical protein